MIFISIICIIYVISLKLNFKLINKNLTFCLILYYVIKYICFEININSIIVFFIGIFLGVTWMFIGSLLLKYPFKLNFLFFKLNFSDTVLAIVEEIIWRGIFIRSCSINFNTYNIIVIIFITILFSYSHNLSEKNYKYIIEFYLFSFLLTITFIFTNNIFITIAIHLCRNNFIINASKECIE